MPVREWWNRHASRVERPEGVSWDDLTPHCSICGFTCMGALNGIDYLYILQDHYTVCRGIGDRMGLDVTPEQFERNSDPDFCYYCSATGFNPDRRADVKANHLQHCESYWRKGGVDFSIPPIEHWSFSQRTFLQFKWNPYQPSTVWVFVPNEEGVYVMLHGFAVLEHEYRRAKYDGVPTKEQAIESCKKYVVAWERTVEYLGCEPNSPRVRYVVGKAYRGEVLVGSKAPNDYYLHRRTSTASIEQSKMLRERSELLASMFDSLTVEKARTRLEVMAGDLPTEGWQAVIHDAFTALAQKYLNAENQEAKSSVIPEPPQAPAAPVVPPAPPISGGLFG